MSLTIVKAVVVVIVVAVVLVIKVVVSGVCCCWRCHRPKIQVKVVFNIFFSCHCFCYCFEKIFLKHRDFARSLLGKFSINRNFGKIF